MSTKLSQFISALLLLTFACTCDRAQMETLPLPNLGTAAQPALYDKFERIAPLFRQHDTTYVINFWATWCAPCLEELPLLNRLAAEYPAIRIVTVSLDRKPTGIARVPNILQAKAPALPALVLTDEEDAAWGKTIDRVWNGNLPTTIIYRGELRYVYRRAFNTYGELERAVEPLVRN